MHVIRTLSATSDLNKSMIMMVSFYNRMVHCMCIDFFAPSHICEGT